MLNCVIYTIINKYVCIDYLGSEKLKRSDLKIGCTGSSKHNGMDYNNGLGIGIPYLLLNLLSCHGFLKNNDYVVIHDNKYVCIEYLDSDKLKLSDLKIC